MCVQKNVLEDEDEDEDEDECEYTLYYISAGLEQFTLEQSYLQIILLVNSVIKGVNI